jgi:hypothetical protein
MLTCKIEKEQLVIRCPFDTLVWAFEASEDNNPYDDDSNKWKRIDRVVNVKEFAKDIKNEMLSEEEDGTTPLILFFEKMFIAAVENGSLGIEEDGRLHNGGGAE